MCRLQGSLSLDSRWEKVRANKLCYNCFSREHTVAQCYSRGRCKRYQARHYTLLHRDRDSSTSTTEKPPDESLTATTVVVATHSKIRPSHSCLQRNVLAIASAGSYRLNCRAQLDMGAMLSLVTAKLARSIKAKKIHYTSITIFGIRGEIHSSDEVELQLKSLNNW